MPTPNARDQFIRGVLSHIKFPFDRKDIEKELNDHIDDRMDDYLKEDKSQEEALLMAIGHMGDPRDIGKELNHMHKPLLGWMWLISDFIMKSFGLMVFAWILLLGISSINLDSPLKYIGQDNIVYHLEVDEQATIDNTVIKITDLIYDKQGTLYIVYKSYSKSILINTWGFGNLGEVRDENGRIYHGGGSTSSGIISHHTLRLKDFPLSSKELNIVYDHYNRQFEFHFKLPGGDADE